MARYRTYKPELFADEKLTECSVDARFLFLGLLPFVDDMGRRQYHPRRIKAEVFPADEEFTWQVVDGLIQELAKTGVIELYDVKGQHYLRVPHFLRHQYVRKPGHCYVPPAPSEGPNAERCRCANCLSKNGSNHLRAIDADVPEGTYRTSDAQVTHYDRTSNSLVSYPDTPEGKGREGKGVKATPNTTPTSTPTPTPESFTHPSQQFPPQSSQENRRALNRSLEEIAMRMLTLLELGTNQSLFQLLTSSIKMKARSKQVTYEAASQQILARAALLKTETPPDDWAKWFADSGYEYVPVGDKRLDDRRIEARPICGGSRCNEGWETVKTAAGTVLRRCPDCERLWREMSV